MQKLRNRTMDGSVRVRRIPAIVRAIDTCTEYVREWGAATYMNLADAVDSIVDIHGEETMTVGTHSVRAGIRITLMSNPPNVVLWDGAAASFSP